MIETMDELQSVGLGFGLGLVVIIVLNAFPGEPFDYENNVDSTPTATTSVTTSRITQVRELEIAAGQLKLDKLQSLLGLEKHKIEEMVAQAKADALAGKQPTRSASSFARWLDVVFYVVILGLMIVVLRAEYSVDLIALVAQLFPREVATMKTVFDVPMRYLPW